MHFYLHLQLFSLDVSTLLLSLEQSSHSTPKKINVWLNTHAVGLKILQNRFLCRLQTYCTQAFIILHKKFIIVDQLLLHMHVYNTHVNCKINYSNIPFLSQAVDSQLLMFLLPEENNRVVYGQVQCGLRGPQGAKCD